MGNAVLTATDTQLTVSNLGSSGQDGVSIKMPSNLTAWEAHWQDPDSTDGLPVGAYVREAVVGTGNGVVNGVLGTVQVTKAGTGNHVVSADFSPVGASTYTVQAYRQGVLVAQVTNQPGSALAVAGGSSFSGGVQFTCCPLRWRGWLDWGTSGTSLSVGGTTVSCDNLRRTTDEEGLPAGQPQGLAADSGKDLLLYDLPAWLTRQRWQGFFSRYREDLIGFALAWVSVGLIIAFAWAIMQFGRS